MGLVPTFFGLTTKHRLLHGYAYEIPRCYRRAGTFSAKSEPRVNSADFEVGEIDQSIGEKQGALVLRA